MSSTSLHDLLTEAESETTTLLAWHVDRTEIAPSWSLFTAASSRALSVSLAHRVGLDPVDRSLRELANQTYRVASARPLTHSPGSRADRRLRRISELLGGAADLMSVQPPTDPNGARLAGARIAAVVAACAHLTATARGSKELEPMCLDAIRLQACAARTVDVFTNLITLSRAAMLQDIVTLPATAAPTTPGDRYAAAAANWRRLAIDDAAPTRDVLAHSAEATGAACHALWQVIARNLPEYEHKTEVAAGRLRAALVAATEAWRDVAASWGTVRTGGPTTQSVRAAAVELHLSRSQLLARDSTHDRGDITGAQRAMTALATLGDAHRLLVYRLMASGQLYIRARALPPSEDLVEAHLRDQWVPARPEQTVDLTTGYTRATQLTATARHQLDLTLQTDPTRARTPQLGQLIEASTRPRAPHR